MKTAKITFFIIFSIAARHTQSMELANTEDAERGKTCIQYMQTAGRFGAVFSGWAFFAATSQTAAKLPYGVRRTPLCIFLLSNTIMHIPTMFGWDKNPAKIGRFMGNISSNNSRQYVQKAGGETS